MVECDAAALLDRLPEVLNQDAATVEAFLDGGEYISVVGITNYLLQLSCNKPSEQVVRVIDEGHDQTICGRLDSGMMRHQNYVSSVTLLI